VCSDFFKNKRYFNFVVMISDREKILAKSAAFRKYTKEVGKPMKPPKLPKGRSSLHDIIKTKKQADAFMKALYECANS